MPIKGLSDRGLAFPEIGQVRKGAKKTANAPGADLTFFRVEFDEREVEATQLFARAYGPQPAELNILLPFNEIEKMWDTWLEAYTAGRLVARSDGEKYIYRVDTKTGAVLVKNGLPFMAYKEGEVVGTWRNRKTNKDEPIVCKPTGRLKVVIPELKRLAYMTVLTTSIHDIINISGQLEALRSINGGNIAGIPLVLRRRPKKISTPGKDTNGNAARYAKWLLSIEADPEWVKHKMIEMKTLALPGNGLALPEPEHAQLPEPDDAHWKYGDDDDDDETEETEPTTPAPDTAPIHDYAWACTIKTEKGTPLETLKDDQLTLLIEQTRHADIKEAAGIIINNRIEDARIAETANQPTLPV